MRTDKQKRNHSGSESIVDAAQYSPPAICRGNYQFIERKLVIYVDTTRMQVFFGVLLAGVNEQTAEDDQRFISNNDGFM